MGVALPLYPRRPCPGWVEPYIGLPHRMTARGPDEYDCWGILMLVLQREAGLTIPAYEGVGWGDRHTRVQCTDLITEQRVALWEPVAPGAEQRFDCVVLAIAGRPLHVGVVVEPGLMLHSTEDANCCAERYDGPVWRTRVDGFWRYRGQGQ